VDVHRHQDGTASAGVLGSDRQGVHVTGHDVRDGARQRRARRLLGPHMRGRIGGHPFAQHVDFAHDADQPPVVVYHRHGGDPTLEQLTGGCLDGLGRSGGQHCRRHEV